MNLSVDLQYGDQVGSTYMMQAGSLTKRQKRGGGLFCQLNQGCWKLHEIQWSMKYVHWYVKISLEKFLSCVLTNVETCPLGVIGTVYPNHHSVLTFIYSIIQVFSQRHYRDTDRSVHDLHSPKAAYYVCPAKSQ